ncbi:hypothetical protein D9757_010480 [Collybiopsis confluens]|uniref:Uncharacterized protein n=1 Tax=Collybiopsis confluens TaxID=2823264 RepID=A0A8H5LXC7_9AGAR|nr:hypothetical protein D9757_010480 [Collybiopsis confluens]
MANVPKLIAVYAGYGDTLLLQLPPETGQLKPRYWLIDGGPVGLVVSSSQKNGKRKLDSGPTWAPGGNQYNSYYQFLRQALLRFCCSGDNDAILGYKQIDLLQGIVVTHPHQDHMDGIIQLLTDWLPDATSPTSKEKPLKFKGPVVLNEDFEDKQTSVKGYLRFLLREKGFERKPWDNIPAVSGLIHGTPTGSIFKMVAKPTSTSTHFIQFALTVEGASSENNQSIITSYAPPLETNRPIVTTGDAPGHHILNQLNIPYNPQAPPTPKTLSIFKVSHHGSQRSNHVATKLSINDNPKEKLEFFLLALSAWYLGNPTASLVPPLAPNQAIAQFRERVHTSRAWDWIAVDWNTRNIPAFRMAMDKASTSCYEYIQALPDLVYTKDDGTVLNLKDQQQWIELTLLLLDRFHKLEEILRSGNQWPTEDVLKIDRFVPKIKQSGKNWKIQDLISNTGIHSVRDVLEYDPFVALRFIGGIREFHQSIDARNYIISSQREIFGLPNPTVIAAIMVAAYNRPDAIVRHLYVTDPWALNMEGMLYYLGFLAPTVQKNQWRDRIKVFYLDQDYVAEVPTTASPDIPGCTEFRLEDGMDSPTVRAYLNEQFVGSNAYNTPFSTWLERSSFSVSILDPGNPITPFGWLNMVHSSNSVQFSLVAAAPPQIKLARTSGAPSNVALNSSVYSISLVNDPTSIIPDMIFQSGKHVWSGNREAPWFKLMHSDAAQILCCVDDGAGGKELKFQSSSPPPPNIARLHFKSSVIVPPTPVLQQTISLFGGSNQALLAPKQQASTEESFSAWWAKVAPRHVGPVTLLDLSKVVLGDRSGAALLTMASSRLTTLIGMTAYNVDIASSPPVVEEPSGAIIVKPLLKPSGVVQLYNPEGGALIAVASISAQISSADSTLVIHTSLATGIETECTFSFKQTLPLVLYLQSIGYNGDPHKVSLAGVAGSIAGFDFVLGFFSLIPSAILTTTKLLGWPLDATKTEITFQQSPIGADVQAAKLVTVVSKNLQNIKLAGLTFSVQGVSLDLVQFDPENSQPYELALSMDITLGSGGNNLALSLTVTQDVTGQAVLKFIAKPSVVSLQSLFSGLGFTPPSNLSMPFNGPDVMAGTPDLVGFTMTTPGFGVGTVSLQSIFAQISMEGWHPWEKVLPQKFWPKTKVTISGILTQPQSLKTLSVGLKLDFAIQLKPATANILLGVSCWPIKRIANDPTQRTKLTMSIDPQSTLPYPSVDDFLAALGGEYWSAVTTAIPFLAQLKSITVNTVFVELESALNSATRAIATFSISATITQLQLLPKLVIEKAQIDLTKTGSTWRAQINTTLLFAGKHRCQALLIFPTKERAGKFEFLNLDDAFTLGAFVKEISPSIDLTTIPIIGSPTLETISLKSFSITALFEANKLSVTSFSVQVNFDTSDIEQLKLSNNQIKIHWSSSSYPNVPSISGKEDIGIGGSGSFWKVDWEGVFSNDWILSAGLQYSRFTENSITSSKIVLSGAILNLNTTNVSAGGLTDFLTNNGTQQSSLWSASVPSKSSFTLKQLAINFVLGEDSMYGIGASAHWGKNGSASGSAVLVIRRIKPAQVNASHWAFMLAVSVDSFHFGDLISDSELAQTVDDNLRISTASVLAFYEPIAKSLKEIKAALHNAKTIGLLPSASSVVPLANFSPNLELKATAGIAIFASLSFGSPKPNSAMESLNIVSNSSLPSTAVHLFGYFSKEDESKRTVAFTATVDSLHILPSVFLDSVTLSYMVQIVDDKKSSHFGLSGKCRVVINQNTSWDLIQGSLDVWSAQTTTAKFSFNAVGPFTLSEIIKLQIFDIIFSGQYDFTKTAPPNPAINSGVVSHGKRSATYQISLSAKISFGQSITATAALMFMSGMEPGVLKITIGSIHLGSLLESIFGGNWQNILNISFEKLFMYYAWKEGYTTPPVTDGSGTRNGKYPKGFYAECEASVYGLRFIFALGMIKGDDEKKSGIKAVASKLTPVNVLCVTLHGINNSTSTGPSFGFSTVQSDSPGFFISAGIALFGTTIGDAKLSYNPNPPNSASTGFSGEFTMGSAVKFLENQKISFELVKEGGKNRLRFVNLPTLFQDFIDAAKFLEAIKQASAKDACGALDLVFDQAFQSSLSADIKLADSDGEDPEKDHSGAKSIKFQVTGHYVMAIAGTNIRVDFKPLDLTINSIPTSLESFGKLFIDVVKDNIGNFVQALLDNADAFAKVLALVALKKVGVETIKSLICREEYNPSEPDPADKPNKGDQKPDEGSNTDKSGSDGDGGSGDGPPDSGGGVGGTPGAAGGGTAAAAAAAAAGAAEGIGGIGAGLTGILLGLFGSIPSSGPPEQRPLPKAPNNPGKAPEPKNSDTYGSIIHDAITQNFEEWDSEKVYHTALQKALDGALKYRAAILLLRQVLQSPKVAPVLAKSVFKYYTDQRLYLAYMFSTLSTRFGRKWLNMTGPVTSTLIVKPGAIRQLQLTWNPLRTDDTMATALTVYLNNKIQDQYKNKILKDGIVTMDLPPLGLDELTIQSRVSAFAATKGGKPMYQTDYAIFAQGSPAAGKFIEPAADVNTGDATNQPNPPSGLFYGYITQDSDGIPNFIKDNLYPTFTIANYTYWAVNYDDHRDGLALLAYDGKNLLRQWDLKVTEQGTRFLKRIQYQKHADVIFTCNKGYTISVSPYDLLALPFVTHGPPMAHLTLPPDTEYRNITDTGSAGDLTKYPVLVLGKYTYWPLVDTKIPEYSVLAIYNDKNKLVEVKHLTSGWKIIRTIEVDRNQAVFKGLHTELALTFEDLEWNHRQYSG